MREDTINTLLNINAFLVVARLGSFSAAARELAVAPSVVTKRITRLEERMRTRLIVRSTRGLALTAAGERFLPRFMRVVAEVEELFIGCTADPEGIEGHVQHTGADDRDLDVPRRSVQRVPGGQSRESRSTSTSWTAR